MSFFTDRRNAVIVSAVVCVLAALAGSYRSIAAEKGAALEFFNGDAEKTVTLMGDLAYKADIASANDGAACLFTLAAKLNVRPELLNGLADAADSVRKAETPASASEASLALTRAAYNVKDAIEANGLSDSDRRELDGYIYDIRGVDDLLARSEYNLRAEAANKRINGVPAVLFKSVLGIDDLEYFN